MQKLQLADEDQLFDALWNTTDYRNKPKLTEPPLRAIHALRILSEIVEVEINRGERRFLLPVARTAKHLSITPRQAQAAIARLEQSGILRRSAVQLSRPASHGKAAIRFEVADEFLDVVQVRNLRDLRELLFRRHHTDSVFWSAFIAVRSTQDRASVAKVAAAVEQRQKAVRRVGGR